MGRRDVGHGVCLVASLTVLTATDGCQALLALQHQDPSAVLLDLHMPVLDGTTLAWALRARHPEVPIVVMTARMEGAELAEEIQAEGFRTLNEGDRVRFEVVDSPKGPRAAKVSKV